MYTDYLKKLFCYLEETKVYDREKNPCRDYEEAIQRLVDLFS